MFDYTQLGRKVIHADDDKGFHWERYEIIPINEAECYIDDDSERKLLINIMRQSNKIWRTRNKVKNGEWDDLTRIEIEEEIEDYLADGQKINAIKYYRSEMKDKYDIEMGLREAKDYIENIHDDMRRRGVISK